jgi:hypothetical protein
MCPLPSQSSVPPDLSVLRPGRALCVCCGDPAASRYIWRLTGSGRRGVVSAHVPACTATRSVARSVAETYVMNAGQLHVDDVRSQCTNRFRSLIIRWGPDASSDVLRRKARCIRCGRKGAMLTYPSWIGEDVGEQPFPVTNAHRGGRKASRAGGHDIASRWCNGPRHRQKLVNGSCGAALNTMYACELHALMRRLCDGCARIGRPRNLPPLGRTLQAAALSPPLLGPSLRRRRQRAPVRNRRAL